MAENLSDLKKQVKRLELEEKLKKLGKSEKKEHKVKSIPSENHSETVKKEINELYEQKKRLNQSEKPKGFLGKLAFNIGNVAGQASLNKKINEKQKYLNTETRIRNLNQTLRLQKLQVEANRNQAEINQLRKRAEVKVDTEIHSTIKPISEKDIFG